MLGYLVDNLASNPLWIACCAIHQYLDYYAIMTVQYSMRFMIIMSSSVSFSCSSGSVGSLLKPSEFPFLIPLR